MLPRLCWCLGLPRSKNFVSALKVLLVSFLFALVSALVVFSDFAGNGATSGAAVVLETCAGAVGAGDGRELFSLQAGGQIVSAAGGQCLGLRDASGADGSEVILIPCDAAPKWEVLGNGQLKLNSRDDMCLTQAGLAPGSVDVAAKAAVTASSTLNGPSHGVRFLIVR